MDTRVSLAHITGSEKTFPVGPAEEKDEQWMLAGFESQLLLELLRTLGLEEHWSPPGPFSALDSDRHFTLKSWLCVGKKQI